MEGLFSVLAYSIALMMLFAYWQSTGMYDCLSCISGMFISMVVIGRCIDLIGSHGHISDSWLCGLSTAQLLSLLYVSLTCRE